jgi:hypothetical protein
VRRFVVVESAYRPTLHDAFPEFLHDDAPSRSPRDRIPTDPSPLVDVSCDFVIRRLFEGRKKMKSYDADVLDADVDGDHSHASPRRDLRKKMIAPESRQSAADFTENFRSQEAQVARARVPAGESGGGRATATPVSNEGPCVTGCGRVGTLRRCTRNFLCQECRLHPEHRLVNGAVLKRIGLDASLLSDLVACTTPNPANVKFPRVKLYFWASVCQRLRDLGREASLGAASTSRRSRGLAAVPERNVDVVLDY